MVGSPSLAMRLREMTTPEARIVRGQVMVFWSITVLAAVIVHGPVYGVRVANGGTPVFPTPGHDTTGGGDEVGEEGGGVVNVTVALGELVGEVVTTGGVVDGGGVVGELVGVDVGVGVDTAMSHWRFILVSLIMAPVQVTPSPALRATVFGTASAVVTAPMMMPAMTLATTMGNVLLKVFMCSSLIKCAPNVHG